MKLTRCQIIGAPAFFPTVWGWIKRWFDPGTTSKIFILSASEVTPTLNSFMEPTSIPKQFGGELDWAWGDMPNLDEPTSELLRGIEQPLAEGQKRREIIKGPVLFNGDHLQVLGTMDGTQTKRREIVPIPKLQASVESEANSDSSAEKAAPNGAETKVDDSEKTIDNVAVKIDQLSVDENHVSV